MILKFIFFLFITTNIFATTYYVDILNGNDSNTGLSELLAWRTIAKVNSKMSTFNPGDEILFKRGEIWNDDLSGLRLSIENISGTSSTPIVFGAYGTGDKPIISSVVSQAHVWTHIGSNIWEADNPPTDHPERLLINGEEKLRANIQNELDGVTFFWRYDESTNCQVSQGCLRTLV